RKGSSASSVTIQGEMVEAKFLARKGPSGTYSQDCMSRALQSLNNTNPKIFSSVSLVVMCDPSFVSVQVMKATSNSKSNFCDGQKTGSSASGGFTCPFGR